MEEIANFLQEKKEQIHGSDDDGDDIDDIDGNGDFQDADDDINDEDDEGFKIVPARHAERDRQPIRGTHNRQQQHHDNRPFAPLLNETPNRTPSPSRPTGVRLSTWRIVAYAINSSSHAASTGKSDESYEEAFRIKLEGLKAEAHVNPPHLYLEAFDQSPHWTWKQRRTHRLPL